MVSFTNPETTVPNDLEDTEPNVAGAMRHLS